MVSSTGRSVRSTVNACNVRIGWRKKLRHVCVHTVKSLERPTEHCEAAVVSVVVVVASMHYVGE
ncbi:MAG: hypothetical protein WCE81_05685 [Halobacteriota archaeon]